MGWSVGRVHGGSYPIVVALQRATQESEMALMQKVKERELKIKHLEQEIKADKGALKQVQEEIDKERSSGKAVWEIVGISCIASGRASRPVPRMMTGDSAWAST